MIAISKESQTESRSRRVSIFRYEVDELDLVYNHVCFQHKLCTIDIKKCVYSAPVFIFCITDTASFVIALVIMGFDFNP